MIQLQKADVLPTITLYSMCQVNAAWCSYRKDCLKQKKKGSWQNMWANYIEFVGFYGV